MALRTHLCFDGQCEIAFRMYERVLGGRITTMLAYGDSPLAEKVRPEWRRRIVHATLEWEGQALLGADVLPPDYRRPQGFFVLLSVPEPARAKLLFEALADGGEVRMPFQATFWSEGFGVLVDRFGVPWEINSEQSRGNRPAQSDLAPQIGPGVSDEDARSLQQFMSNSGFQTRLIHLAASGEYIVNVWGSVPHAAREFTIKRVGAEWRIVGDRPWVLVS